MKKKTFTLIEMVGLGIAVVGYLAQEIWGFVPFEGDELTWWLVWAVLGGICFAGFAIAMGRAYNLEAALKRRYQVSNAIYSEWKQGK